MFSETVTAGENANEKNHGKLQLICSGRKIMTAGIDRSVMHVHNEASYNLHCSLYVYVHTCSAVFV